VSDAPLQIVWFKRDLRVDDHAPLRAAAEAGPVVGLYILEPEVIGVPESHPRHWEFVLASLVEVRRELRERGSDLLVRRGEATAVVRRLVAGLRDRGVPVGAVRSHEETGLDVTFRRDLRMKRALRDLDVEWVETPQFGVVRGLRDRDGWARRWAERMDTPPVGAPERFAPLPTPFRDEGVAGEIPALAELMPADRALAEPATADRAMASPTHPGQPAGEAEAHRTLASFLGLGELPPRGVNYRADMASPLRAVEGCSRLSPHLAYGTISLRRVHHATESALAEALERRRARDPALDPRWIRSLRSFRKRLRWHCHFIQKLESQPALESESFNTAYDRLRPREADWGDSERDRLDAWLAGRTGHPMIDASMRALEATGWINFRMRAMVVSFAAYHLWLDWRPVARELARYFTDYEPGIHISQVQMQSGVTGINRLRMYSPAKQLIDNDPDGTFVRTWIPELRGVPAVWLAHPHKMPRAEQNRTGCRIGVDYPAPIVDHAVAVREARSRIAEVRGTPEERALARRVYERHGSRKGSPASPGSFTERRPEREREPAGSGSPTEQLGLDL
jgi:deoxyribodipyrimidine photo-lyase